MKRLVAVVVLAMGMAMAVPAMADNSKDVAKAMGLMLKGKTEKGVELLKKQMSKGNSLSAKALGDIYRERAKQAAGTEGAAEVAELAVRFYGIGEGMGNTEASRCLYEMYSTGETGVKDMKQALEHLKRVAEKVPSARKEYGLRCEEAGLHEEAIVFLLPIAEEGTDVDLAAVEWALASAYFETRGMNQQQAKQALRWAQKTRDAGNRVSIGRLVTLYGERGATMDEGTYREDCVLMAKWGSRKAAEKLLKDKGTGLKTMVDICLEMKGQDRQWLAQRLAERGWLDVVEQEVMMNDEARKRFVGSEVPEYRRLMEAGLIEGVLLGTLDEIVQEYRLDFGKTAELMGRYVPGTIEGIRPRELADYCSKDLQAVGLRGHVKRVKMDDKTVGYDTKGCRKSEYQEVRDEEGRIVGEIYGLPQGVVDANEEEWMEYKYSVQGQELHTEFYGYECEGMQDMVFSTDGLLLNEVSYFAQLTAGVIRCTQYTYTNFDEKGNWTERRYRRVEAMTEENEEVLMEFKEGVEKQVVEYYTEEDLIEEVEMRTVRVKKVIAARHYPKLKEEMEYSVELPKDGEMDAVIIGALSQGTHRNAEQWLQHLVAVGTKDFYQISDEIRSSKDCYWDSFSDELVCKKKDQLGHLLCMERYCYAFSGGVHGNWASTYYTFDLEKKRQVMLDDLLTGNYKPTLERLLKKGALAQLDNDPDQLFEVPQVTENFYLTDEGIVFSYAPYEIACYAAGQIDVLVKWEEVEGWRKGKW